MVFALKMWRHFISGEPCKIYTYHKSLKYIFTKKELNIGQKKWLELLKDYKLTISYHLGKANMVVDTLSRKNSRNLATLITTQSHTLKDLIRIRIGVYWHQPGVQLANLKVELLFLDRIKVAQANDPFLLRVIGEVEDSPQFQSL